MAYDPTVMTPSAASPRPAAKSIQSRHVKLGEQFLGETLGNRYLLKSIVGAGGFGAVFEGEDTRIKKKVAVKLLFADMLRDHEAVIRFKLEAEAASQVGHVNIIDITDFDFTEDSTAYMVMEFLEGEDLAHIIRRAEKPDLARLVRLCVQACRGLGAAHKKGIVHRDLKPGNIFVNQRESVPEQVKVVDFGISRASELDDSEERLTKTGQILGTPYYMAPEQADGIREVDGRTDIYAMGIILYEACTGELPFKARTPIGLITKHASEVPKPPRGLNAEIPELLQNTILKALEKNPEDRFGDMVEMEQALLHCLAILDPTAAALEMAAFAPGSESLDRPLSQEALAALTTPASMLRQTGPITQKERRSPLTWVLGVVAVLAVAAVVVVLVRSGGSDKKPQQAQRGVATERGVTDAAVMRPPPRPRVMERMAPPMPAMVVAPPMRPKRVRITCKRVVPRDADVRDSKGDVLGNCKRGFLVPHSTKPIRVYLTRGGYIRGPKFSLVPDRNRVIRGKRLARYKKSTMGSGDVPDAPIQ